MNILIIESERLLANALVKRMLEQKYAAEAVYNGLDGLEYARSNQYDVIIVDSKLPGRDGLTLVRTLRREKYETPILMISARGAVADRIEGLDNGADDYLGKPFAMDELLARVRALSRRKGEVILETVEYGDLQLSLNLHELRCGENTVHLNRKEFDIIHLLMVNSRIIIPKETMITKVWGYESNAEANNVEAYISFLRRKLKNLGSTVRITTLRKVGYRLDER